MDETELAVLTAVSRDPLRHAGLVHDIVCDRRSGRTRGIDPKIVERHREAIRKDIVAIAPGLMDAPDPVAVTGVPAEVLSRSRVQSAIAQTIHHTHQAMMALGLARREDMPPLAAGRAMFAAEIAADVHRAISEQHPDALAHYEERAGLQAVSG